MGIFILATDKSTLMYRLIPALIFSLLLVACGGSEEETTDASADVEATDTLSEDTLVIEVDPNRPEIDVNALLAKSEKNFDFPLTIDSTFIDQFNEEAETEYDLTWHEVKYLAFDWVDNNTTSMASYDAETFIELDSIAKQGDEAWEAYQNSIDLGMARYSNGYIVGTIELDEKSQILLWATDYATYEACPYGYGTCVFGTLFTTGIGINTALLGEISGGGDPPVWGSKLVTSEITAEMITITSLDQWGEEDYDTGEEIIEVENTEEEVQIIATGLQPVKEEDAGL